MLSYLIALSSKSCSYFHVFYLSVIQIPLISFKSFFSFSLLFSFSPSLSSSLHSCHFSSFLLLSFSLHHLSISFLLLSLHLSHRRPDRVPTPVLRTLTAAAADGGGGGGEGKEGKEEREERGKEGKGEKRRGKRGRKRREEKREGDR